MGAACDGGGFAEPESVAEVYSGGGQPAVRGCGVFVTWCRTPRRTPGNVIFDIRDIDASTPVWARNQISLPAGYGERLFLVAERVPAGKAVKQDGTPLGKGVVEVALCRRELVYDVGTVNRGVEASAPPTVGL